MQCKKDHEIKVGMGSDPDFRRGDDKWDLQFIALFCANVSDGEREKKICIMVRCGKNSVLKMCGPRMLTCCLLAREMVKAENVTHAQFAGFFLKKKYEILQWVLQGANASKKCWVAWDKKPGQTRPSQSRSILTCQLMGIGTFASSSTITKLCPFPKCLSPSFSLAATVVVSLKSRGGGKNFGRLSLLSLLFFLPTKVSLWRWGREEELASNFSCPNFKHVQACWLWVFSLYKEWVNKILPWLCQVCV